MGKWELFFKTKKYYDIIKNEYHQEPEFNDLISYRIIATSKQKTKENFTDYKIGWALIGKDISNADKVYKEWFENDFEEGVNHSNEYLMKEIDSIIENTAANPYYKIEDNSLIKNDKLEFTKCTKCKKAYFELNHMCPHCEKEEKKWEKIDIYSFNTFLYIGIGILILYFILQLGQLSFILLGSVIFIGILYFQDKIK